MGVSLCLCFFIVWVDLTFRGGSLDKNHLRLTLQIGTSPRLVSDSRLNALYPSQGWRQLIALSEIVTGFRTR